MAGFHPSTEEKRELLLSGVGVGTAVATAGGGLGALAAIPDALRIIGGLWSDFRVRRAHRLLSELYGQDLSDEDLAASITEAVKKPHVEHAVVEAVTSALDVLGEHVIPALAKLVAEYSTAGTMPDAFFRSVCRLLKDVDPAEYVGLVALVRCVAGTGWPDELRARAFVTNPDSRDEDVRRIEGAPDAGPFLVVDGGGYIAAMSQRFAAPGCNPAHARRLFQILDREGLGQREQTDTRAPHVHLRLGVLTAKRLANVLV